MLVNVVDVPPLCNFILPAIVRTGPLAIAISTAGASPALAKRMKREIAELFGEDYARLAVMLNDVRGWAKGTLPTYQDRKEFFEGIVNGDPDPIELLRDGREPACWRSSRPPKSAPRRPWLSSGARQGEEGDRREVGGGGGDHEQVEDLVVAEDRRVRVRAAGSRRRPRRPCRGGRRRRPAGCRPPPSASQSAGEGERPRPSRATCR